MRSIIYCALLVAVASGIAEAQPSSFTSVGMGGGGALYHPAISPHDRKILYTACDMSALYRTTSTGAQWLPVNFHQIQSSSMCGGVCFTSNPAVHYALSASGDAPHPGKTTDAGVTWEGSISDPTGGSAWYIAADPANANRILVTDYRRLWYSATGGSIWKAVDSTTSPNGYLLAGAYFDSATIYVATNIGIRRSVDNGATFTTFDVSGIPVNEAIVSCAIAKQGITLRFIAVTLVASNTYAGITGGDHSSYQGVYTFDLGGFGWVPRSAAFPAGAHPFFAAMSSAYINTAYVAGGSASGAPIVYATSDGGATWTEVLKTGGNANIKTGWSGSGGDRGWSYGEYALGLAVNTADPSQVMITDLGFAHMSTNNGLDWTQLYVAPADANGESLQIPRGKAYHGVGFENTSCWNIAWTDSLNIFGCFSDIHATRTTDGGTTWSQDITGIAENSVYDAFYSPQRQTMFAATSTQHDIYESTTLDSVRMDGAGGKILQSLDTGRTWVPVHDFQHPVVRMARDAAKPNSLYASVVSTTEGGIYVSNDIGNGATSVWTRLAEPPRTKGHPLSIVVLKDGSLVCTYSAWRATRNSPFTASSGVFYSTNKGVSWQDRSDPGLQYWTKEITVDPFDATQRTWYVGAYSGWGGAPNGKGGVYVTHDRGLTWTRMKTFDRVTRVTCGPTSNELYVTTETEGLWYCPNRNDASPTWIAVSAYPFRQPLGVFLNPYNDADVWVSSFGYGIAHGRATVPPRLPAAPALLAPANSATKTPLAVTLVWSSVEGADSYDVELATDSAMSHVVKSGSAQTDTAFAASALDSATTYFWRARATNVVGNGAWSITYRFTTIPRVLPHPTSVVLLYPRADTLEFVDTAYTFRWHISSPAVDKYSIAVWAFDSDIIPQRFTDTAVVDTAYFTTLPTMPRSQGRMFLWTVAAHNASGWGVARDTAAFFFTHFTGVDDGIAAAQPVMIDLRPNPASQMLYLSVDRIERPLFAPLFSPPDRARLHFR
jgi:hypothetical protein